MSSSVDKDVPQWKKDLIARLRNQNKRTASAAERQQQLCSSPPQSTSAAVGRAVQQPCLTCGVPNETVAPAATVASVNSRERVTDNCNVFSLTNTSVKMVRERSTWDRDALQTVSMSYKNNGDCTKNSDSDSSEDLHYGPGIVNKLKNKYLSLALRESNSRPRLSILPMRKAASLENILDDGDNIPNGTVSSGNRLFQSRLNGSNDTVKNASNRYRNTTRGSDLKRARSVETISRSGDHDVLSEDVRPKRESLHEEMLIADKDGSDKPCRIILDNKMLETAPEAKLFSHRINRPKRITPIMNEKEKPPVDVVKHTKMIFERRPEQRTRPPQQTGEVAAKVATYKSIIVQAKAAKKPPIKVKPVGLINDKPKTNGIRTAKTKTVQAEKPETPIKEIEIERVSSRTPSLPSPIPDISRIDFPNGECENGTKTTSLTETPDLIMTSSPLLSVSSNAFRISATENFILEEIRHSVTIIKPDNNCFISPPLSPPTSISVAVDTNEETENSGIKPISAQTLTNINNASNTMTFNFVKANNVQNHLPVNKNVLNTRTPPSQPLKLEINGVNNIEVKISPKLPEPEVVITPKTVEIQQKSPVSPPISNRSQIFENSKPNLTNLEIEKNLINKAKTLEQPQSGGSSSVNVRSVEEVIKIQVPKVKKPPREPENNSIVFKFTDRKDVPDYVQNDGSTRVGKIEKPKVGEGGIILLPGASVDESFTDEDEEIMRSLEAPPSPCDVTFINDNVLIDGKSSLNQKTKKAKMKISFVESTPDIFIYPSETSMLVDFCGTAGNAQVGQTVPSLAGSSSLANYTPKGTEDFLPGVTRSTQNIPTKAVADNSAVENSTDDHVLHEVEQPILFSAGTNTDILF